jgi:hypothetical protein
MDSDDRKETFVFSAFFASVVAAIFMITGCVLEENKMDAPAKAIKARSEHVQKVYCIRNRGDWTTNDKSGNNTVPHCQF